MEAMVEVSHRYIAHFAIISSGICCQHRCRKVELGSSLERRPESKSASKFSHYKGRRGMRSQKRCAGPWIVSMGPSSSKKFVDDAGAGDGGVGQGFITPVMAIDQFVVVDAQLMQDRCEQVVHSHTFFDRTIADVVRGAVAAGRLMSGQNKQMDAMLSSLQITGSGKTVGLTFALPAEFLDVLNGIAAAKGLTHDSPTTIKK